MSSMDLALRLAQAQNAELKAKEMKLKLVYLSMFLREPTINNTREGWRDMESVAEILDDVLEEGMSYEDFCGKYTLCKCEYDPVLVGDDCLRCKRRNEPSRPPTPVTMELSEDGQHVVLKNFTGRLEGLRFHFKLADSPTPPEQE